MSLADIREQIVAVLSGVSGIEIVHRYVRLAFNREKLLELFKDSKGKICGWMITRRVTAATRKTMPVVERDHTFRLYGIYGVKDGAGSELVFQDMIEDIQDAFDDQYSLGDTVTNSGPIQVKLVEYREIGGILCHYAELDLWAWERKT